ncbi:hypothetical protein [Dyadobacter sp. MSC1_007]|jgi:hypothetical protein|uniref:hypothetical protein n=1 Tax=Dyadobacter sp. MSC1_007 TaxID=2909264 RepID=UPI00202F695C|nr:hypothetical protein [Dyadobacter sp. MSC1_007]
MPLYKNGFFIGPSPSSHVKYVRQAIRKKVMSEYQLEFEQAKGWRKSFVKWKLNLIAEIRYRGILFMGAAGSVPDDFTS